MRWADAISVLRNPAQLVRRAAGAVRYPFDRFTVGAKLALNLAQDEAERMQTSYIGASHLLLGLLRDPDGLASGILEGFGLEVDRLREVFAQPRQPEQVLRRRLVPTTAVRRIIERAFDESVRMRRANVGTDHLLAGLIRYRRAPAAQVLSTSGITLADIRERGQAMHAQGMRDGTRSRRWADLALEKLSENAEAALVQAARAGSESGSAVFNSEHILLGILAQDGSLGRMALERVGITVEDVRPLLHSPTNPSTGSEAHMSGGVAIGLRRVFLDHQGRDAIDSGDLLSVVLDGGGLGSALLASHVSRQQLDDLTSSLRSALAAEKPIGRFTPVLRNLWHRRALSRAWSSRFTESRADLSVLLANAVTPAERAVCANNLAWIDLLSGEDSLRQESLVLAEDAVRTVPHSRPFRGTLALALIENGRPAEGAAILQRDGTHDPDPSTAAERTAAMALAMWRMGNHDQARLLLERATALDPHAPVLPRATDEIQPPTP